MPRGPDIPCRALLFAAIALVLGSLLRAGERGLGSRCVVVLIGGSATTPAGYLAAVRGPLVRQDVADRTTAAQPCGMRPNLTAGLQGS